MTLHKEQFDKFVTAQKKDSKDKEQEIAKRIEEMRKHVITERDSEKEELIAAHAEEVKNSFQFILCKVVKRD